MKSRAIANRRAPVPMRAASASVLVAALVLQTFTPTPARSGWNSATPATPPEIPVPARTGLLPESTPGAGEPAFPKIAAVVTQKANAGTYVTPRGGDTQDAGALGQQPR